MNEQDRRAGMDRWLQARYLIGAGIILNGAIYTMMVFVAAIVMQWPIARDLAIATAGVCYFAYIAQLAENEHAMTLLGVLSTLAGLAAGIALLMGV